MRKLLVAAAVLVGGLMYSETSQAGGVYIGVSPGYYGGGYPGYGGVGSYGYSPGCYGAYPQAYGYYPYAPSYGWGVGVYGRPVVRPYGAYWGRGGWAGHGHGHGHYGRRRW